MPFREARIGTLRSESGPCTHHKLTTTSPDREARDGETAFQAMGAAGIEPATSRV